MANPLDGPRIEPDEDPFARELAVLQRAQAAVAGDACALVLKEELAALAGEYGRLLRHLRHLTRISDRSQGRLHAASARLDTELERQVGREIKEELLHGSGRSDEIRRQHLTIMFSDIRDFTTLAEQLSPEEVIHFLKCYYEFSLDIVHRHGGLVKSFMGDGMMVVFGYAQADHTSDAAVTCALELVERLGELNVAQGTAIRLGVGLHSGPTAAGHIGTRERSELAIIGNTVNLASRIEAVTRTYGVPLLFSGETLEILRKPPRPVRLVDTTNLRGQRGEVKLYTL